MKRIKISVAALLLSSGIAKAQVIPEVIDIRTLEPFGRSEMMLYCEDLDFDDLQYFYLGKFNNNYHYVKYTGAKEVTVLLNDKPGDTRELCTKQGNAPVSCKIVDSFAAKYSLVAREKIFQVWISKPNVK